MRPTYNNVYIVVPGDNCFATPCTHGIAIKPAMVAGNIIIDEANIGGITPEVFTFKGRCVLCPPKTFFPTTLFAY